MEINRQEILRYLGYRGAQADETVMQAVESALTELTRVMVPKAVTRPVTIRQTDENVLELDGIKIESKSLRMHLNGCEEGVLFAATLGAPVDQLIHRYNVVDVSKAVILQACAAAAIEAFCDETLETFENELEENDTKAAFRKRRRNFEEYKESLNINDVNLCLVIIIC